MFKDPNVYPCREAVTHIAKAMWAALRGDQDAADRHVAAADAAQQAEVERYNATCWSDELLVRAGVDSYAAAAEIATNYAAFYAEIGDPVRAEAFRQDAAALTAAAARAGEVTDRDHINTGRADDSATRQADHDDADGW